MDKIETNKTKTRQELLNEFRKLIGKPIVNYDSDNKSIKSNGKFQYRLLEKYVRDTLLESNTSTNIYYPK